MRRSLTRILGAAVLTYASQAQAGDTLVVLETKLDPPTLIHLGVQVTISDDDDRDAVIDMRYREVGAADWRPGLPLFRVRPELVTGLDVPAQFAGSVFGLRADTEYELELHASDPDGFDDTWTVLSRTRAVPGDPQGANMVAVSDTMSLQAALGNAAPGDVITLAAGTYDGPFSIEAAGTAAAPIVIRGASREGTILDGGGCEACNVLEVYGAGFVHLEQLTIQAASRALRFQSAGAEGNVVRRVHIRDVRLGIGAREDQRDFYLCDNTLEGRLVWPQVYADDGGMFANEDGIVVMGDGHVVCHNRFVGFGDAIKSEQSGARSVDFYGNVSLSAYDNGMELDETAGNTRMVGNMFVNSWSPLSFQPIFGGPAYAIRNVVVNVADEQQKLHSNLNSGETVGAILLHNTFVSPRHAINLQAAATAHEFRIYNNLYVGPAAPDGGKVVDWSVPIDGGLLDGNGYYPDGMFDFGGEDKWPDFAAMKAAGKFEANGVLLTAGTFASGLVAPASYTETLAEPDVTLAADSPAVDAALPLPGVNSQFLGAGPDIGALELGCPLPIFGVRPEGVDESTPAPGCDDGTDTDDITTSDSEGSNDGSGDPPTSSDPSDPSNGSGDSGDSGISGDIPTDGGEAGTVTMGASGSADTGASTGTASGGEDEGGDGCGCRGASSPGGLLFGMLLLRRGRSRPRATRATRRAA